MRNSKLLMFMIFILLNISLKAQIVLSEVMFDPDTLEWYCEYVEIYNNSDVAVNLDGWSIGTSEDADQIITAYEGGEILLQPGMYGLILDQGYFEHNLNVYQLPDSNFILLKISDASFGSGGLSNSREDTVLLVNPELQVVQQYQYSIDNESGYSDEKIDLAGSNYEPNWENSLCLRGTPGYKNSVSIPEFNLKVGKLEMRDRICSAYIYNTGSNSISQNLTIQLYIDLNFNSILNDSDSLLATNEFLVELEPFDSTLVTFEAECNFFGNWFGWINMDLNDEYEEDNINSGNLSFNFTFGAIILNELMIKPDEYGEWIELHNSTDSFVSLHGLKMIDSRDTVLLVNLFILPESYLILCQNEEWVTTLQNSGSNATKISWLTLNNSTDHFKILDSSNSIIDEAFYDVDEMNIDMIDGYSLERIKPLYSGRDIWNWALCVDVAGHTAGMKNSVLFKNIDRKKKLSISPNPFSPDGDGYDEVCQIALQTNFELMNALVKVFSLDGKMVKKWNLSQIPGNYILVWDGKDNNGIKQPLGLYIVYAEMINRQNGKKIKEKKSLVIAYKK